VYIGQFDFAGIVSGIFNVFILLAISVGIYEIGGTTLDKIKDLLGGRNNG
jgi:hypothetical protein